MYIYYGHNHVFDSYKLLNKTQQKIKIYLPNLNNNALLFNFNSEVICPRLCNNNTID